MSRKPVRSTISLRHLGLVLSILFSSGFALNAKAQSSATPAGGRIDRLWDVALAASHRSGKPALIFDVDYVDSTSKALRDNVIANARVRHFIDSAFEVGIVDFSVDPPPSVGFDSLRNLGNRLDGLEKQYQIVVRPTVILLRSDGSEIDRISFANKLNAPQFITRVQDIMAGRNTLESYRKAFYADTTSLESRMALIEQYEERSKYDSVLRQLEVLKEMKQYPQVSKQAALRYGYMRMQVEGNLSGIKKVMASLGHSGEDSILNLNILADLLTFYKNHKLYDSAAHYYDAIMAVTGVRDPDFLNEFAWNLASYTTQLDSALMLINEAMAKRPNEPNYYDTRALIHFRRKERTEARKDAELALANSPAGKEDKEYFEAQLKYYKEHEHDKDVPPEEETDVHMLKKQTIRPGK